MRVWGAAHVIPRHGSAQRHPAPPPVYAAITGNAMVAARTGRGVLFTHRHGVGVPVRLGISVDRNAAPCVTYPIFFIATKLGSPDTPDTLKTGVSGELFFPHRCIIRAGQRRSGERSE